MPRKYKNSLFIAVMALYLAVPAYLIARYEIVLTAGTVYKFRPVPVDPLDYLRGRYVTLRFNNTFVETDTSAHFDYRQEVYVMLRKDPEGFARYAGMLTQAPSEGDYFKTKIQSIDNTGDGHYRIAFDLPLDKFFLNEKIAPEVESRYNTLAKDSSLVLEASVRGGRIVPKELLLNGKPIGEAVREGR